MKTSGKQGVIFFQQKRPLLNIIDIIQQPYMVKRPSQDAQLTGGIAARSTIKYISNPDKRQ
jgi:hypothetical protein